MKVANIIVLGALGVMTAGCVTTPPVVMESAFQKKVITPCDNDIFCFRWAYSVTWDSLCRSNGANYVAGCNENRLAAIPHYPVSYRSSEYIVETGSDGYIITMPAGGTVRSYEAK